MCPSRKVVRVSPGARRQFQTTKTARENCNDNNRRDGHERPTMTQVKASPPQLFRLTTFIHLIAQPALPTMTASTNFPSLPLVSLETANDTSTTQVLRGKNTVVSE